MVRIPYEESNEARKRARRYRVQLYLDPVMPNSGLLAYGCEKVSTGQGTVAHYIG